MFRVAQGAEYEQISLQKREDFDSRGRIFLVQ